MLLCVCACVCVCMCVCVCACACVSGAEGVPDSPGSSSPGTEEQEVDVEVVQGALRALHQELRDSQRDRVLSRPSFPSTLTANMGFRGLAGLVPVAPAVSCLGWGTSSLGTGRPIVMKMMGGRLLIHPPMLPDELLVCTGFQYVCTVYMGNEGEGSGLRERVSEMLHSTLSNMACLIQPISHLLCMVSTLAS